ncbi:MAG: YbaB/EbfC family nucleoid-associated protein [Bacteroidales bacterium]|nr:YbaB/EbfC family nucleoid-associated protein [Bacteroidales bacterium]
MIGDLLGKLKDVQANMEASKQKLEEIIVQGQSEGGMVKVSCTANKRVIEIIIDPKIVAQNDAVNLQQLVMTAVNNAMNEASKIAESEMKNTAKGMMPNIPGLF